MTIGKWRTVDKGETALGPHITFRFNLLASAIESTVAESSIRANFALPFRVTKMGWMTQLLEKSSSSYSSETSFDSGMSDNASAAINVFVAQSDEHLLIWDFVPWTVKEWSNPKEKISLVQTRVLSTQDTNDNGNSGGSQRLIGSAGSSGGLVSNKRVGASPKITLRYGEERGIICYAFQVATKSDYTAWLSTLIQGPLYASKNLGTLRVPCTWKASPCLLAMHVDRGFTLTEKATQKELWAQPYSNLCSSNDDGAKLLWLQFRGKQEEDEFVLQVNPKVVVFTLHNFLSTKLQLLGKSA